MRRKEAERLRDRLPSLETGDFATREALPPWALEELPKIARTTAEPDATLPEKAPDVRGWIRNFILASGMGDRFLVATGIEGHQWLTVRIHGESWLDELVDALGEDLRLVSPDVLVAIYAEEYEYQAFLATPTHRRDADGAIV
ncbi:hypothetical protein [Kutzneria sp. NPDC052558]|uniref:hypothetical protein n=1 Tax=Kutzneria sp. NPDC052558 TaxID=3364121 RepID=UPI0037C72845